MVDRSDTNAGRPVAARFTLVDHHGKTVTERSYRGRNMLVFFGFTHCKKVCPRALSRLSTVLDRLGPAADLFVPLYVTVDPDRDTPMVMRDFLTRDHPRFTGLTGTSTQIDAAKSSFRVFARRVDDPDQSGGYQMPHSAFTFVFDIEGAYSTHFSDAVDEDELVRQLRVVSSDDR
ncbi:SCO family protein [Mycolicibacterium sp. P9-64]|nr:SCO family protein [Mycolicibacterium sp. P9-64]